MGGLANRRRSWGPQVEVVCERKVNFLSFWPCTSTQGRPFHLRPSSFRQDRLLSRRTGYIEHLIHGDKRDLFRVYLYNGITCVIMTHRGLFEFIFSYDAIFWAICSSGRPFPSPLWTAYASASASLPKMKSQYGKIAWNLGLNRRQMNFAEMFIQKILTYWC